MISNQLRAIDLYSGVGGWSLGLHLAGIEVVSSYERWEPANRTNRLNNRHSTTLVDLRKLDFSTLPGNIDLVVGSPPCTQFSFSNKGGGGDIKDGLEDIKQFLAIVDHVKPTWWIMENVPRLAAIIKNELEHGGRLYNYRHLNIQTHIFGMDEFGLPQRRRRCLAGNITFDRIKKFSTSVRERSLGEVVHALQRDTIIDPLYGIELSKADLTDHDPEPVLSIEELRMNRASKQLHPVYNAMPFPDPLDKAVRTITATCTRVSRESVVIEAPETPGSFRRLTVRERACLQGFPVQYQFYGATYAQKLRMIGNAVPPAFSYIVGLSLLETELHSAPTLKERASRFAAPALRSDKTVSDTVGRQYPRDRNFRFAIPSLRLKSGVRFELVNSFDVDKPGWRVDFYFGSSKSIHVISPDASLYDQLYGRLTKSSAKSIKSELSSLSDYLAELSVDDLQDVWNRSRPGICEPFHLLDKLSLVGSAISDALSETKGLAALVVSEAIQSQFEIQTELVGVSKVLRHAPLILAGLLVGGLTNRELSRRTLESAELRRIAV